MSCAKCKNGVVDDPLFITCPNCRNGFHSPYGGCTRFNLRGGSGDNRGRDHKEDCNETKFGVER